MLNFRSKLENKKKDFETSKIQKDKYNLVSELY